MCLSRQTSTSNRVGVIDRSVCFFSSERVNMYNYLSDSWLVGKRIALVDDAEGGIKREAVTTF